jgi:hypothetical protein
MECALTVIRNVLGDKVTMRNFLNLMLAASLAFFLVACGTDRVEGLGGPIYVASVSVADQVESPQMRDLQAKVMAEARLAPQTDNPKNLRLTIIDYHKKNAGLSLIVGDSNKLNVQVEVIDPSTNSVISKFNSFATTDAYVNGVIGALVAGTSDDQKVQAQLNTVAARDIMEHLYGSKAWKQYRQRK